MPAVYRMRLPLAIRQALDDRPDPWARVHQPADPETIARTLAFAEYALREAVARYDGLELISKRTEL